MELNLTTIALWILGIACGCTGWFARQVWSAVQKLKDDVSDLRVQISTDYVRYDRMQDAVKPIMDQLHEITRKLDSKADK